MLKATKRPPTTCNASRFIIAQSCTIKNCTATFSGVNTLREAYQIYQVKVKPIKDTTRGTPPSNPTRPKKQFQSAPNLVMPQE